MKAILGNIKGYKVNDSFLFKMGEISPYAEPFYLESNNGQSQEFTIKPYRAGEGAPKIKLQCSSDGETWGEVINISSAAAGTTLQIPATGKLYMRATANWFGTSCGWGYGYSYYNLMSGGTSLNVGGNILSLVTGSEFCGQKSYSIPAYAFYSLMRNLNVTDASGLIFPNNVGKNWYAYMFSGRTTLIKPPKILPAMTLASYCYDDMFYGCKAMTTAPELPATTLDNGCYRYLFYNCNALQGTIELPATILKEYCYQQMFYNCSALAGIKCHATDITPTDCISRWVYGVGGNGTFYKKANVTYPDGQSGIPSGWTVVDL